MIKVQSDFSLHGVFVNLFGGLPKHVCALLPAEAIHLDVDDNVEVGLSDQDPQ